VAIQGRNYRAKPCIREQISFISVSEDKVSRTHYNNCNKVAALFCGNNECRSKVVLIVRNVYEKNFIVIWGKTRKIFRGSL
jgi:hypothetical protein